jgi:hypothetical protein
MKKLSPVDWQLDSGQLVLRFQIGKTIPGRVVRHDLPPLDLADGLATNPDDSG